MDDGIPSYEKLVKMQNDPENQTPMQREYNALVQDEGRLTQAILMQMRQMIDKKIKPSWGDFTKTRTWMVLSMNITEENRQRYGSRWRELYQKLTESQNAPDTGLAVQQDDSKPSSGTPEK